jgi:Ring finger domain
MYTDNLRQINNYHESINSLNHTNVQILNVLVQILNPVRDNQPRERRNNNRQNHRSNTFRDSTNDTSNGLGRIFLNNTPYIIDSIQEYRIPPRRNNRNENFNTNFSQILQNFFQPIEVYPTPSQIESATRRVRYCDIISPRNRSCPISLDTFNDSDMVCVIRFCGHIFNTEELHTWFRSNCRCPVCRYDIRNYNSNASSEFFGATGPTDNSSSPQLNNQSSEGQNDSSQTNEERSSEQTNSFIRNNTSNMLGTLINRFVGDMTPQEEEVVNYFMDLSGNNTNDRLSDPVTLLRLFSSFNNNNFR